MAAGKRKREELKGEEPVIAVDRAEQRIFDEARSSGTIVAGVRRRIDRKK